MDTQPEGGVSILERTEVVTQLTGEHDRMAHIVFEGFDGPNNEWVKIANVTEALINRTPVKALCGKIWVPDRSPKNYPVCDTCKEIATRQQWPIPA